MSDMALTSASFIDMAAVLDAIVLRRGDVK